ncbi:hypothetical protein [Amycolatopsis sp. BJA-103]|uniref:hypothetical protein n=1 Tax=Amycolatopsis sp. BJA-103 TaxID=1911175 RepID=UPI001304AE0E|nr:hypothetical protein [Amycolatopsis sp. BJA-103]
MRDRDEDRDMTASPASIQDATHDAPAQDTRVADLVAHAAIAVSTRGLAKVTDAGALDREDAGAWLSRLLCRRIEHRNSRSEHLFVDVTTGRAVRLVLVRRDTGEPPMIYMAQSPGTSTGTEPDFYRQLVNAARPRGRDTGGMPGRAGGGRP